MASRTSIVASVVLATGVVHCGAQSDAGRDPVIRAETQAERDARLAWWREARFGLFIHWGLYAIHAGEWQGNTGHGEWIRHTARIPTEEYDQLVGRFNPVKFNAQQWVRTAKDAGVRYIVITSKHHDGFCLFDSQFTDYDVMSTPFRRDILKELAAACRAAGIRMCWYHSIMDWHHPDYLPRREWEKRPAKGARLDRYVEHMKSQLRELVTNYGPIGVLWFDGEWEPTWTHERGVDLYHFVRGLQPDIIINNRVDVGRAGMAGMSKGPGFVGDFGTPEQEVPATGFPGVDWETCLTMNDHWGYNKHDHNWKSSKELIRMLADIASKGGNFLLNVGPTAEGEFPAPCVERLRDIGAWMNVSGEAIYGTLASPFKSLPWGRCTQRALPDNITRLYLHVFDWPADGKLVVSGLLNDAKAAAILGPGERRACEVTRDADALVVAVPKEAPDPVNTVVVLDLAGRPDVGDPPLLQAECTVFVDSLEVMVTSSQANVEFRYTTDGRDPTAAAPLVRNPLKILETATVKARAFRGERPVSGVGQATFTKVVPRPADKVNGLKPGIEAAYYEGTWDKLPEFDSLTPAERDVRPNFDLSPRRQAEHFAFRYRGWVTVPRTGVYRFFTVSDDGSRLYIGDKLVVDNDGLHAMAEAGGVVALEAGAHPITVTFFQKTGELGLEVWYAGPGLHKQRLPSAALSHDAAAARSHP